MVQEDDALLVEYFHLEGREQAEGFGSDHYFSILCNPEKRSYFVFNKLLFVEFLAKKLVRHFIFQIELANNFLMLLFGYNLSEGLFFFLADSKKLEGEFADLIVFVSFMGQLHLEFIDDKGILGNY